MCLNHQTDSRLSKQLVKKGEERGRGGGGLVSIGSTGGDDVRHSSAMLELGKHEKKRGCGNGTFCEMACSWKEREQGGEGRGEGRPQARGNTGGRSALRLLESWGKNKKT